jgi:beta-hydroxylase
MSSVLLAPKFIVLYVFLISACYVHLRGRVRFRFLRQVFNHSTLLAPYNALMYLFSAVPPRPILDPRTLPELAPLTENWRVFREEAQRLFDEGYIREALKNNDIGFNSFFKRGWKRFYLKWYDEPLPSARALCPKSVALLQSVPQVNGAMIALLSPHSTLNPHRDPYAGSLRYHLGLVTANSEACHISVDGERYHWRDGEALVFDETYIHSVENNTEVTRLILLCDVQRPLRTRLMNAVNGWVCRHIIKASATQNTESERVGLLNRFYANIYHPIAGRLSHAARRLKRANRTLYRVVQVALIGAIFFLIFA